MKSILAVLLFVSTPCFADDWTRSDTKREATYLVLHIIDWAQSRYISRNPDNYCEQNFVLGCHPHQDKVDAYFLTAGVAHAWIASSVLSDEWKEWRAPFQHVTIGFEVGYVGHNLSIGVEIKF